MTGAAGTTHYAYDAADQPVSAMSPSGGFLYSYDLDGNLLSRTYPNALKTTYSYNDAGEMITATVKGKTTLYSHDPNGNLVSTLHPSGILDTRAFDAAGHLTGISAKTSDGKPFYSRSYTYDPVGNPLLLSASTSGKNLIGWSKGDGKAPQEWRETYSYDSRDRLTKSCMDEACSRYYEYAYDEVGNRLSQTTQKATTRYSYDAADELQTETTGDKVTVYAYDANGNETRAGDTHYAYNLENKLTSQKGAGKQASYTYTGEGLVSTRRIPSETTSYAWDTSSDLPELALETVSKGKKSQTSSYTYGAGPIGLVNEAGSYAFHTDSLGSVAELSDAGGNSVESYRYSPYGEAYAPGDSAEASSRSSNPIRFTGQYFDSESDLYNMRAREYEPGTGRFMQVDPLETDTGSSADGVYVYVNDQPTVMTDPNGERGRMRAAGGLSTYNRQAAQEYARTGYLVDKALGRIHPISGANCTDFVSYVLRAGGWAETDTWKHSVGHHCAWGYCLWHSPTDDWANAQHFYDYWRGIGAQVRDIYRAETGDVILMKVKSSAYSHAVIVDEHTPGSHSQIYIEQMAWRGPLFPLLDWKRHHIGSSTNLQTTEDRWRTESGHKKQWPVFTLLHIPDVLNACVSSS
jgi:RHS repeat-associated protein